MKKRSNTTISLIVLFTLIIQTSCTLMNPPQDGLRQFFKAIDQRDYDTAILHCTGNMQDNYILGQKLENWCVADDEGDISIKILNVDLQEEDKAYITFELHIFTDDSMSEKKLLANLVNRKGKWLVDDVNEI